MYLPRTLWIRQILLTLQGNIPVDLASTERLSSSDVVLELIFRFLLADLPFLAADSPAAPFSHCSLCQFIAADSIRAPGIVVHVSS
jgi:hypothetical protein